MLTLQHHTWQDPCASWGRSCRWPWRWHQTWWWRIVPVKKKRGWSEREAYDQLLTDLDVISVSQPAELLLASSVPHVEPDGAPVSVEHQRMDLTSNVKKMSSARDLWLTSTPRVATYFFSNSPVRCLLTKVVLPVPPSPTRTNLKVGISSPVAMTNVGQLRSGKYWMWRSQVWKLSVCNERLLLLIWRGHNERLSALRLHWIQSQGINLFVSQCYYNFEMGFADKYPPTRSSAPTSDPWN